MAKTTVSLKISDRYNIIKYAYQIPCTLAVRMAFDDFVDSLAVSDEEEAKAVVKIENGVPHVENDFATEYKTETFPKVILDAIEEYIERLTVGAKAPNATLIKTTLDEVNASLGLLVNE